MDCSGFVQVMENLEVVEFIIISISRPGKAWNLSGVMESHGKAICFLGIKRQKDKK